MAFQSFDFERTWWRLFQKRVVCTKFDIYVLLLLYQKEKVAGKKPLEWNASFYTFVSLMMEWLWSYGYLFYLCPLTGCYVIYGSSSTPPSAVIYGCPCHIPLVCHGLHIVEVPLGETGNMHYFCCICLCCSSWGCPLFDIVKNYQITYVILWFYIFSLL